MVRLNSRCSTGAFLEPEARIDERGNAQKRPAFVAGDSGTRSKTRASVTRRTWAYQSKSAFSDLTLLALLPLRSNVD